MARRNTSITGRGCSFTRQYENSCIEGDCSNYRETGGACAHTTRSVVFSSYDASIGWTNWINVSTTFGEVPPFNCGTCYGCYGTGLDLYPLDGEALRSFAGLGPVYSVFGGTIQINTGLGITSFGTINTVMSPPYYGLGLTSEGIGTTLNITASPTGAATGDAGCNAYNGEVTMISAPASAYNPADPITFSFRHSLPLRGTWRLQFGRTSGFYIHPTGCGGGCLTAMDFGAWPGGKYSIGDCEGYYSTAPFPDSTADCPNHTTKLSCLDYAIENGTEWTGCIDNCYVDYVFDKTRFEKFSREQLAVCCSKITPARISYDMFGQPINYFGFLSAGELHPTNDSCRSLIPFVNATDSVPVYDFGSLTACSDSATICAQETVETSACCVCGYSAWGQYTTMRGGEPANRQAAWLGSIDEFRISIPGFGGVCLPAGQKPDVPVSVENIVDNAGVFTLWTSPLRGTLNVSGWYLDGFHYYVNGFVAPLEATTPTFTASRPCSGGTCTFPFDTDNGSKPVPQTVGAVVKKTEYYRYNGNSSAGTLLTVYGLVNRYELTISRPSTSDPWPSGSHPRTGSWTEAVREFVNIEGNYEGFVSIETGIDTNVGTLAWRFLELKNGGTTLDRGSYATAADAAAAATDMRVEVYTAPNDGKDAPAFGGSMPVY